MSRNFTEGGFTQLVGEREVPENRLKTNLSIIRQHQFPRLYNISSLDYFLAL